MGSQSMRFESVQRFMREQRIDAWLLYEFRGSNPVFAELLPGDRFTTRRIMLFIPAEGEPERLVHRIDATQFLDAPFEGDRDLSWGDLHEWLVLHVEGCDRV